MAIQLATEQDNAAPVASTAVGALWVAATYSVFSLIWIVTSDRVLEILATDHASFAKLQTYKGSVFVVVTALLIYALVKRQLKALVLAKNQETRVAELLRDANAGQQLALNAAQLGSWSYNLVDDTILCDERAALHFGVGPITPAATFFSALHPDDRPRALLGRQSMLYGEPCPQVEYRFRQSGGGYRWIAINATVIHPDAGQRELQAIGTSKDITIRRASDEALRASEALLKIATDNTGVGLVVLDKERRYTFVNRAYTLILGTSENIIGKSPQEVLKDGYENQIKSRLDRAYAGERVTYELFGLTDPSRRYSTVYDPRKDEAGNVTGVTITIFEITELRRSEEALRQTERDLNRAQAVAHTGSWRSNQITGERSWSKETYRIYNVPFETPVTLSMILDPVHPEDKERLRIAWRDALRGEPYNLNHRIIVDGKVKWLHQRAELECSADGRVLMVFGTVQDITEAKRFEDALRASEGRFRGIYERALANILLVGWDGTVESANPAFCNLVGYTEDELRGRHFQTLIDPDDRNVEVERRRQLRAGEIPYFMSESRYLHKNGQPVWVRKIVSTLPGESGKPASVFALSIDETEARKSAEALRTSERRLKLVMAATGEGVWDWLVKSDVVQHNAQWCQLLGLDDDHLEHTLQNFLDLIHIDDRASVLANVAACLRGDKPYFSEYRIRRANGEYIWTQDRGNVVERAADGQALRMVGSMVNITERKVAEERQAKLVADLQRSEAEARQQKALQQSIFESTPDGMALTDLDRKVIHINPAFTEIFGYKLGDLHGLPSRTYYATQDDCDLVGRHIAAGKNGDVNQPLNCLRKSGEVFPVQMTGAKLLGADGTVIGYLGVYRDITQELKRDRALREKQRLEALGRVTGGVAHDFNNLLTVISGNIQLVDMNLKDERMKRYLAEAYRATEMGARLNQRLMTFARQRQLEPVTLNLNTLINALLDLVRRSIGESIRVKTNLTANPANVLVDASEMESAILNLALNARDAMPDGGCLLLESRNVEIDGENASAFAGLPSGPYIYLAVSDTGLGMMPEVMSRAFEPFFTTKDEGKGTGLGLTTIHGFVRQSGGNVTLYSELGHGTTVNIYLPSLVGLAPRTIDIIPGDAPSRGRGETILVVEDNPAVRRVTCDRLITLGYAVVEAENGTDALALANGGTPIDLVFSDIIMPGGISGFELAKRLRANHPELKLLLTSGFPEGIARVETPGEEKLPILRKPYSQEDLARSIATSLANKIT